MISGHQIYSLNSFDVGQDSCNIKNLFLESLSVYIMNIVSRDFLKENIIHLKDIYYFGANFQNIIYTRLHSLSRNKSRHSYSFIQHLEHKRKARNKPNRPSNYQNSYHESQIPKLVPFSPEVGPSNSLKSVQLDFSCSFSSLFYLFFLDYRISVSTCGLQRRKWLKVAAFTTVTSRRKNRIKHEITCTIL